MMGSKKKTGRPHENPIAERARATPIPASRPSKHPARPIVPGVITPAPAISPKKPKYQIDFPLSNTSPQSSSKQQSIITNSITSSLHQDLDNLITKEVNRMECLENGDRDKTKKHRPVVTKVLIAVLALLTAAFVGGAIACSHRSRHLSGDWLSSETPMM